MVQLTTIWPNSHNKSNRPILICSSQENQRFRDAIKNKTAFSDERHKMNVAQKGDGNHSSVYAELSLPK